MFWDQISTARHTGSRLIHLSSRDAHTDPTRHLYDIPRKSNVTYRQTHSKTQSRLISSSNVPLSQSCRPHIRKKHQQTLSLPPPIQSSQRTFTCSSVHRHNHLTPPKPGEERKITFIDKEGQSHTFDVADGDNLLDIAQDNDLDMEGACGGSCACSTCHVIVRDDEMYDKMVSYGGRTDTSDPNEMKERSQADGF